MITTCIIHIIISLYTIGHAHVQTYANYIKNVGIGKKLM